MTLASGGLFLSADHVRPIDTKLTLLFEVPGGFVQAEAVVRNVSPGEWAWSSQMWARKPEFSWTTCSNGCYSNRRTCLPSAEVKSGVDRAFDWPPFGLILA